MRGARKMTGVDPGWLGFSNLDENWEKRQEDSV